MLEQLAAAVWPDPDLEPDSAWNQVRQAVGRLRKALQKVAGDELTIWSERGIGYALMPRRRWAG